MKQVSELLETGVYETFTPDKTMTVKDLLKELNLEGKYFGILINGKKATEDMTIKETDEIVILPHIAGGL
jgi:sulfur carrier protein ThiS